MLVAVQSRLNGELGGIARRRDPGGADLVRHRPADPAGRDARWCLRCGAGWCKVWRTIRRPMRGYGGLRWWQCLGGLAGAFLVATQSITVSVIGVAVFLWRVSPGRRSAAWSSTASDSARPVRSRSPPLRIVGALIALAAVGTGRVAATESPRRPDARAPACARRRRHRGAAGDQRAGGPGCVPRRVRRGRGRSGELPGRIRRSADRVRRRSRAPRCATAPAERALAVPRRRVRRHLHQRRGRRGPSGRRLRARPRHDRGPTDREPVHRRLPTRSPTSRSPPRSSPERCSPSSQWWSPPYRTSATPRWRVPPQGSCGGSSRGGPGRRLRRAGR